MLDFVPKLSCAYCDMNMIINDEKYMDEKIPNYHLFLSENVFKDFHWAYTTIRYKFDLRQCFVHVACPKCVDQSGDYEDDGQLTLEAEIELTREYNTEEETTNEE